MSAGVTEVRYGSGVVGSRDQERLATWVAAFALFVLVLLPLGCALTGASFDITAPHWPERVLGYIGSTGGLLARSLAVASAVTLCALAIGVPLAVVLGRTDVVGWRAALVVHALPMFLPPFILGLGWFYLLGRAGPVGSPLASKILFGPVGVVGVLALAFSPIVTCLTLLGMSAVDPALEDAAALVARRWAILRRIVLPAARPAMALAALLVFSLAFSEVGVPMFLRVRVYPAAVLARLGGFQSDPAEAALLTLPLLAVGLSLVAFERAYVGDRAFPALGLRRRDASQIVSLGRWRSVTTAGVWGVILAALAPLAGLMTTASRADPTQVCAWLGSALGNSLLAAAAATLLLTGLALVVGWSVARRRPNSMLLDMVSMLGFLTPAPLMGVGLIALWNRPATASVYGSLAIVVLGYLARYNAVGIRAMATAVMQAPASLEEAAALSGAGFVRRLIRITAPVAGRGLALAAVLTFVFCLRDLETAVLYYPAGSEPLPVRILTLEANGPAPVIAGIAVIHVVATMVVVVVASILVFRSPRR